MENIFTVKPATLNTALAEYIKNTSKVVEPANVDLIKTGSFKQRFPSDQDWYFKRAASILRKLVLSEIKGSKIGVRSIAKLYGGSLNRGSKPSVKVDGSKGIIRKIIKDFENVGWVEIVDGQRIISEKAKEEILKLIEKIK